MMANEPGLSTSYPGLGSPPAADALPLHMIPEDLLQGWIALPPNHVLGTPTTKQDLDNLFFAISNLHFALDTTNRAFVQWSNGQVLEAQSGLEASRRNVVSGMNCLRQFFEALISREVGRSRDG